MAIPPEHIMLVESNPALCDLIARQTLEPLGFRVSVVRSAIVAIQEAVRLSPDLIIADLNLPGLSGKDLLVALSAQGVETPVIVLAESGMEGDVIQAFRLGAADYLGWPIREAEVVTAVERVMRGVREQRERILLARQLQRANRELQRRVRELTTLFAVGKAVTSITEQSALFEKLVEGAVYISEADCGWFLLRKHVEQTFLLGAYRNLPPQAASLLNQPWEDEISSLVALSGESLSIHGEPLRRFNSSNFGQAALIVPVKVKTEVVGLLVVARKKDNPFKKEEQALLEAVADYASISFVNAQLFRALQERASSLQKMIERKQQGIRVEDIILKFGEEVRTPLMVAMGYLEMLQDGEFGPISAEQMDAMQLVGGKLQTMVSLLESSVYSKVA